MPQKSDQVGSKQVIEKQSFNSFSSLQFLAGNDLSFDGLMNALVDYELSDVNTPLGSPGKLSGVITLTNTDFIIEKGKICIFKFPSLNLF